MGAVEQDKEQNESCLDPAYARFGANVRFMSIPWSESKGPVRRMLLRLRLGCRPTLTVSVCVKWLRMPGVADVCAVLGKHAVQWGDLLLTAGASGEAHPELGQRARMAFSQTAFTHASNFLRRIRT